MARILNQTTEYIDKVVEERISTDYKSYTRFLEGAPIFVTYYKQNIAESTTDRGMGNVYGNSTSSSSPKKYNKIEKLPLFNVDKSSFDIDIVDNRLKGEYNTKGNLLPNTIEPIPEDYIVIHYMKRDFVFKVTGFSIDNIKSDNFYEIQFKYNGHNFDHLEADTVESFTCIYEKIGTEDKCIISNTSYNKLEQLLNIEKKIADDYIDLFFDNRADCFIFNMDSIYKLYDPYITRFISNNKLFEKDFSSQSYHIEEKIIPVKGFEKKYKNSIYKYIENRCIIARYYTNFRPLRIYDISTYFGNTALNYCQIEIYDKRVDCEDLFQYKYIDFDLIKENPPVGTCSIHGINDHGDHGPQPVIRVITDDSSELDCEINYSELPIGDEIIDCELQWREKYIPHCSLNTDDKDDEIDIFENLIRMFLNKDTDMNIIEFIMTNLSDLLLDDSNISYYIYTPIVLYIIKNMVNNIKISN